MVPRVDSEGKTMDKVEPRRREKEAKRMAEKEKRERSRRGVSKRKGKEPKINYKALDPVTYSSIHHRGLFAELPRDSELGDSRFWCAERKGIYEDVYVRLNIRPMHPLILAEALEKPHLVDAMYVAERMGLHHLMALHCSYDSEVVKQFFSTLVICGDEHHTMKWMTRDMPMTADFHVFAEVLGCSFRSRDRASGHRIITQLKPNKDVVLSPCTMDNGIVGTLAGLAPIYAALVGLFRDSITPSGGNNDSISGYLIQLLAFSHEVASCEDESMQYKMDVMDFIYHELTDAMFNRLSIPYAPYIMMLIRHLLLSEDFNIDVVHKAKKIYNKVRKTSHPSSAPEALMRGARRPPVHPIAREIKQLNWFQRHILCMGVDIRKGQYEAYKQRHELAHSQQLILHHVIGASGDP